MSINIKRMAARFGERRTKKIKTQTPKERYEEQRDEMFRQLVVKTVLVFQLPVLVNL